MSAPTLILPIKYDWQENQSIFSKSSALGDGYTQNSDTRSSQIQSISITAFILTQQKLDEVLGLFEQLKGRSKFKWRPTPAYPLAEYFCENWNIQWDGQSLWTLTATFSTK